MKPIFSRETVFDRRQPHIRWTAVLAGTVLALGLWNLFQLLFVGGALTAINPDEIDHLTAFGIGTGIGSVLAPLIAMFVGGLVAGRLASHYDHRVNAAHGALVWAFTSVLGLVIMANVIGSLVGDEPLAAHDDMAAPPPGSHAYVEDRIRLVNQDLKAAGAPTIDTGDFLDASRYAAGDGRAINRDAFVSRLDANTKLSRPEAELVLQKLGNNAPDLIFAGQQLALHRHQALQVAENTGKALLAAGGALFLCLLTAFAGSIMGARRVNHRLYDRPNTIPGHPAAPVVEPIVEPVVE
jgi:hypothetical protein